MSTEPSQIILKARDDTNEWKTVFVLLSAVVAHVSLGDKFSGLASTEPGDGTVVPEPGIMLTGSKEVDAVEVDKRLQVFPHLMVIAADELEDIERATQWALRAFSSESEAEYPPDFTTMLYVLSHAMSSNYEQVLDLALKLGVAFTGSNLVRQMETYDGEADRPSVRNFLGSLPTEIARKVYINAMGFALLPQLLRLGTLYVSGKNGFQDELAVTLSAYRSFAQSVSNPGDWSVGTDIMEQAFSDSVSYQGLLAKSKSSECQEDLLKILCYLAASLKPGMPVEAASQAHSAVAH